MMKELSDALKPLELSNHPTKSGRLLSFEGAPATKSGDRQLT